MNTLTHLNKQAWMVGLTGLVLIMGVPAQAAPHHADPLFLAARSDDSREMHPQGDKSRASKREAEKRDDAPGYGYGYERRQRQERPRDNADGQDTRQRHRPPHD
jgi:hypothetical protein